MEPRSAERGNLPYHGVRRIEYDVASMEPRSAERGNVNSHGVIDGVFLASMEPRSAERGNKVRAGQEVRLCDIASMEPRSAERGNAPIATMMRYTSIALQWSHAQLSVEIQHRPIIVSLNPKLQWSHAQLSVEIPFSSPAASLPRRFNGATLS